MRSHLRLITSAVQDVSSSVLAPSLVGHGEALWPRCLTCKRSVDAYGIAEETRKYVEYWCRCDGIAGIYGGAHARSYRAGIRIDKTKFQGGWTTNRASEVLSRLCLREGKFAKWELVMGHANSVEPVIR
jgi:hypothetical protein